MCNLDGGIAVGRQGTVLLRALRSSNGDRNSPILLGNQNTNSQQPIQFHLEQNYPNPFNAQTQIRYSIPLNSIVKIDLFNVLGQKVKSIVNEYRTAGSYTATLDATNLASGVYLYKIQAGDFMDSKKMVIIK